jgi:CheY-like chemotaxis protein
VSLIQGKRVLVVEDEFFIAMTTCEMLHELGAIVVGPAHTVAEASALAKTAGIDIALLDVNLYGESSATVAATLAARGIPVVFATGYTSRPGDHLVGAHVLGKPFTQETLAAQLNCALEEASRHEG